MTFFLSWCIVAIEKKCCCRFENTPVFVIRQIYYFLCCTKLNFTYNASFRKIGFLGKFTPPRVFYLFDMSSYEKYKKTLGTRVFSYTYFSRNFCLEVPQFLKGLSDMLKKHIVQCGYINVKWL